MRSISRALTDAVISEEKLFSICFGDSEETASELFAIADVTTLTEKNDDGIVAMATLVPLRTETGACGFYAYGVCVHPDHRGKGAFHRIMASCEAYAEENGADFLCLIPADERLADTYGRMGYTERLGLYHNADTDAERIFVKSQGFIDFAAPEGNEKGPIPFGLMKPLGSFDRHNMAFFSPMGDC